MTDQQEMATEILVAMLDDYPVNQVPEWTLDPDKFRTWVIETHKMVSDAVKAEWPVPPRSLPHASSSSRGAR